MSKLWITTFFIAASTLLVGCQKDSSEDGDPATSTTSQPFQVVSKTPTVGDTNNPVEQKIDISFTKSVVDRESKIARKVDE